MPVSGAVSQHMLQIMDIVLALAGIAALLTAILIWWRSGHQDPLRGSPIRLNRLTPLWLWFGVAGQLLCWTIAGWLASVTFRDHSSTAQDPRSMLFSGSVTQVLLALMSLGIAKLTFMQGWRGFGIGRRSPGSDLVWALAGWLVAMGFCSLAYWATVGIWRRLRPDFAPPDHIVVTTLADPDTSTAVRALAFAGALVLAPISEELFFRGIIQTGVQKLLFARWGSYWHRWVAIAVTATLFGAMHTTTPQQVPALIVLAIILGYLYERSGSLGLPILVHMFFNGKTLVWVILRG